MVEKKLEAANWGGLFASVSRVGGLLQLGRDAGEVRVQLRAESIDDRDDRDRNTSGDEAVLDGGSARVVLQKGDNFTHLLTYFLNGGDARILFHNF